jgi:formylglycine-generating enzyme required for sulfatase activity
MLPKSSKLSTFSVQVVDVVQLRIFLSSPGDVANERAAAREILNDLPRSHLLKNRATIEAIAWDDDAAPAPMDAATTPQNSVNRYTGMPRDCDLTVVILWSRIGTPLPDEFRKPDGSRFDSGTVWEFEDAKAAQRPIWLYRCTIKPTVEIDDPQHEEKRRQYQGVNKFFEQFRGADGSLSGGINLFDSTASFADQFRKHLEAFINDRLTSSSASRTAVPSADPLALAALAALGAQTQNGAATSISDQSLRLILSHAPRSLDEYRLGRIAEWSQPRFAIDKRFTPLTLLLDQGEQAQGTRWQAQRQFADLREVLQEVNEPAIVVLGPPGCGKSTLLRRLELDLALSAMRDQAEGAPSSVFLPLNSYRFLTESKLTPQEWIAHEWARRWPGLDPFDTLLRQGKLVLLLDAVNEMPHAGIDDYRERIGAWRDFLIDLTRSAPGTRVIFTCRELDYSATLSSPDLRVPHVRIERLSDSQVEEFLSLYSPEQGPALWKELKGTPQLDLFRSPFYLRMLLAQADGGGTILSGRAALFTGFVRQAMLREMETKAPLFQSGALIERRDHEQLVRRQWRSAYDLPERSELIPALAKFAFDLQHRREGSELAQVRSDYDQAVALIGGERADALIRGAVALQVLEQPFDEVFFIHQLLQEYFAARYLVEQPEQSMVALALAPWRATDIEPALETVLSGLADSDPLPPAPSSGWEETMLLAVAMASAPEQWISELAKVNLPLAGRCAAQADLNISETLREEIGNALIARCRAPEADIRARIAAARVLGELGDPRFIRRTGPHGDYLFPPLIAIAGGEYSIGSDEGLEDDEAPIHPVTLAPFALGQFPVTNAEYRCFIDTGGYEDERWWQSEAARRWRRGEGTAEGAKLSWREWRDWYKADPQRIRNRMREGKITSVSARWWEDQVAITDAEFETRLDGWFPIGRQTLPALWNDPAYNQGLQPVVGIGWHEARAYCAWLSAQTGNEYRLPTEAEWEAAARGKKARTYAWGKKFDAVRCNTFESHIRGTTPVGVFPEGETPEGLTDLSGNVFEWTSSLYRSYPYRFADGREAVESADDPRVLRGGSWLNGRNGCRCTFRYGCLPVNRDGSFGFRVCCAPPII